MAQKYPPSLDGVILLLKGPAGEPYAHTAEKFREKIDRQDKL